MKRIIPFLVVLAIVLFAGHLAVYELLVHAWPALIIYNTVLRFSIIVFMSMWFILGSLIVSKSANPLGRAFYILSAYWLGLFAELLLGAAAWSLLALVFPGHAHSSAQGVALLAILVFIYGSVNAKVIRIKEQEIMIENIPDAWRRKKVVMLSDLHLGAVNGERYAMRLLKKIRALKPDLIFVVGDFYDGVKADEEMLAQVFAPVADKMLFVTGNHDGFVSSEQEIAAIRKAGIRVLENESVEVDGVRIIGLDYHSTHRRENAERIMSEFQAGAGEPSILLKHVPLDLDLAEAKGVSLSLSGHTHNGQVWPGSLLAARAHKGFSYGLKRLANMQVFVSSGAGTWGPPMRVGTQTEIVVLKFL